MSLIINEFVTVESSAHIKQNRDTLVLGTQTQWFLNKIVIRKRIKYNIQNRKNQQKALDPSEVC